MLKSWPKTAPFVTSKTTTPRGAVFALRWKLELKVVTLIVVVTRAALRVACADADRRAPWAGIPRAANAAMDTKTMATRMRLSTLPFICFLLSRGVGFGVAAPAAASGGRLAGERDPVDRVGVTVGDP